MININRDCIWVDVIEDIPDIGCNMTSIPLYEPLHEGESMKEWLEAHGYCDIVDFRVVIGDWVMPWGAPESEWVWIQGMTKPYYLRPPSAN